MKIQLEWLKEYVDFDLSAEKLGDLLTMGGLEVECLEHVELPDGRTTEVIELNVTPNRGYCLSYFGVAREVAAGLAINCRFPSPEAELEKAWRQKTPVQERISVENREEILCPRYSGLVIENVTPGPSPKWLVDRLSAIGLRPINNIVDITNYVMMEYGQPLHAFDRELLSGPRIVIRRAEKNEPFTCLDGTEIKLGEDALVIADADKPVALAGVMGGENSQVSESTRHLVLESACFDPVTVRKGSKKYGLRTDSSIRFERGIDIDGVIHAQSRAALLIRELAGGEICRGRIDLYPNPSALATVVLRVSRVEKILGIRLEPDIIRRYLERLGLKIVEEPSVERPPKESFAVEIPGFRPTLSREIDLIEEVARLHGYGNVIVTHPTASISPVRSTPKQSAVRKIKETLCHLGFSEAVNYSFIDQDQAERFKTTWVQKNGKTIPLSNPLSSDMGTMRTSLLPGLLTTAARNLSRGQKPVKVFEVGEVFCKEGDKAIERTRLAVLAVGLYENSVWKETGKGYDYYDLKGVLETTLEQLKVFLEYRPADYPFLEMGKSVNCLVNGKIIGFLGELPPLKWEEAKGSWKDQLSTWEDLKQKCYIFEIDVDALMERFPAPVRFRSIPKFPETYRDISIVIDKSVQSKTVADLIREVSAPLISRVELYDQFDGKKIEKGRKSLTFALSFHSAEKTLTDEEVNPVFDKIVKTLSSKLGATLRD